MERMDAINRWYVSPLKIFLYSVFINHFNTWQSPFPQCTPCILCVDVFRLCGSLNCSYANALCCMPDVCLHVCLYRFAFCVSLYSVWIVFSFCCLFLFHSTGAVILSLLLGPSLIWFLFIVCAVALYSLSFLCSKVVWFVGWLFFQFVFRAVCWSISCFSSLLRRVSLLRVLIVVLFYFVRCVYPQGYVYL